MNFICIPDKTGPGTGASAVLWLSLPLTSQGTPRHSFGCDDSQCMNTAWNQHTARKAAAWTEPPSLRGQTRLDIWTGIMPCHLTSGPDKQPCFILLKNMDAVVVVKWLTPQEYPPTSAALLFRC